jgi:hypothetical protein
MSFNEPLLPPSPSSFEEEIIQRDSLRIGDGSIRFCKRWLYARYVTKCIQSNTNIRRLRISKKRSRR